MGLRTLKTMKFRDLLVGNTEQAQQALDVFFASIDEEKILWYPSAGKDYRDLMEITPERLALHGISEQPNIICHTDYHPDWTGLDQELPMPMIIHQHARTTIKLLEKLPLAFAPDANIRYQVRRNSIDFYDDLQPYEPTIYFLKLNIVSDTLGEFDVQMFYFMFENHSFLKDVILKKRLPITHFVKVRQGCGFGGCRKCISVFYSLLANIGVKYLLVDAEVHYCHETHAQLSRRFLIRHKNYKLMTIGTRLNWSGYYVKAYKVVTTPGYLDNETFNINLAQITEGWGRAMWEPQAFLFMYPSNPRFLR